MSELIEKLDKAKETEQDRIKQLLKRKFSGQAT
jgi:hypothetical protein